MKRAKTVKIIGNIIIAIIILSSFIGLVLMIDSYFKKEFSNEESIKSSTYGKYIWTSANTDWVKICDTPKDNRKYYHVEYFIYTKNHTNNWSWRGDVSFSCKYLNRNELVKDLKKQCKVKSKFCVVILSNIYQFKDSIEYNLYNN